MDRHKTYLLRGISIDNSRSTSNLYDAVEFTNSGVSGKCDEHHGSVGPTSRSTKGGGSMASSKSRVNEEKLLNEMFVLLEYSDNFYEFVSNLSKDAFEELRNALKVREMKEETK
jgi:hypothetical protein